MRRLVAVGALLVLAACGSGSSGASSTTSAADSVEQLMRALDDGDCAAAKDLVVTPGSLDCEIVEGSKGSFADEGIDLDETTYKATKSQDDSATVAIAWGNGAPAESYDVQRVEGDWKVVFDSAA